MRNAVFMVDILVLLYGSGGLYKVMICVFWIRLCPNVCSSSMGRMAS